MSIRARILECLHFDCEKANNDLNLKPRFPLVKPFIMMIAMAALYLAAASAMAEVVDMQFSADGQYLAILDTGASLYISEVATKKQVLRLSGIVRGETIAWRPDSLELAAVVDDGKGWGICLVAPGGTRRRLTTNPASETSPQWSRDGKSLFYASWRDGDADLWRYSMDSQTAQPLLIRPYDQWSPRVQPGGDLIAFYSIEDGKPVVCLVGPSGNFIKVGGIGQDYIPEPANLVWDTLGKALYYVERLDGESRLHEYNPADGTNLVIAQDKTLRYPAVQGEEKKIYFRSAKEFEMTHLAGLHPLGLGRRWTLTMKGLPIKRAQLWNEGNLAAVIVEGGGVAIGRSPESSLQIIYTDREPMLICAERFYELGQPKQAEKIYEALKANIKDSQALVQIRVHQANQLRRQGDIRGALAILSNSSWFGSSLELPPEMLMARAGILFFEERQYEEARVGFRKAIEALAQPTEAFEPLLFLLTNNKELIGYYADAHEELRRGNAQGSLDAMRRLADLEPGSQLVRNAILDLLNNPYENETIGSRGNPFSEPRMQDKVIAILKDLEKHTLAESPMDVIGQPHGTEEPITQGSGMDRVQQELLQRLLDSGRLNEARALALEILKKPEGAKALGVTDFLKYYLETERHERVADQLLGKVLLHPSIVPTLEKDYEKDSVSLVLLTLAQLKLTLLEGNMPVVQRRVAQTQDLFATMVTDPRSAEIEPLAYYLRLYEAKYYERLGNYPASRDAYDEAIALVEAYQTDKIGLYLELRAAQGELTRAEAYPEEFQRIKQVERGIGDWLLNPTDNADQLRLGLENFRDVEAKMPSTPLQPLLDFEIGLIMGRTGMGHQAFFYFDKALASNPIAALRARILWEKAAIAGLGQNWWLQLETYKQLLKAGLGAAQRDSVRLKMAAAMMQVGQVEEGRKLLIDLRTSAALPSIRDDANYQLESLDGDDAK